MLLSAMSVLVVAQSIFKIPEGLMNNPVYHKEIEGISILELPLLAHSRTCVRTQMRDGIKHLQK